MALAVYVHIPYCLQRCRYCDFTTFEWTEILPPERYVQWVLQEIRQRRKFWSQSKIGSLYFGGGTPSLISSDLIVMIVRELANNGLPLADDAEATIEINPATMDENKLQAYLAAGINRFSVGAQTFNDSLLKKCGRKHNSQDTHETLRLLHKHNLNYSFDLLFALPGQSLEDLRKDLEIVSEYSPPHLSAYCLTVPEGHPMNRGRAPEAEQVAMFDEIESHLRRLGLVKYEISNFAKPGFESRHNIAYWTDKDYWGIGLSSHSYQRSWGNFGTRFWNPKSLAEYEKQVFRSGEKFADVIVENQRESLNVHEALTDFTHTHLRTGFGMPKDALHEKFPETIIRRLQPRLDRLESQGLVTKNDRGWRLTSQGQMVSNKVFEELCFLPEDVAL